MRRSAVLETTSIICCLQRLLSRLKQGLVIVQVGDDFHRSPVPSARALPDTLIDIRDPTLTDVSAGVRHTGSGQAGPTATNRLRFTLINTASTYGAFTNGATSTTSPFTWASGVRIAIEFDYPVA
jgi:hypothetical protein